MSTGRDRAYPRAAAAVRYAERLVQVQVRHVGTEGSRPGQPHQGIQVGAVDVDLAARLVHLPADCLDRLFEHAVGGRVGQHDRRYLPGVRIQLGRQVSNVYGAVRAALDHHDLQAREHRARRVRAVRRLRDQADSALRLVTGAMIGPDRQQPGEFSL